MKVYGIYISDYESGYYDTPFYASKERAYDALRPKLLEKMEETRRMQDFTKWLFDHSDYKNWKQETPDKWIGGYCDYESIEVVEIEVT